MGVQLPRARPCCPQAATIFRPTAAAVILSSDSRDNSDISEEWSIGR